LEPVTTYPRLDASFSCGKSLSDFAARRKSGPWQFVSVSPWAYPLAGPRSFPIKARSSLPLEFCSLLGIMRKPVSLASQDALVASGAIRPRDPRPSNHPHESHFLSSMFRRKASLPGLATEVPLGPRPGVDRRRYRGFQSVASLANSPFHRSIDTRNSRGNSPYRTTRRRESIGIRFGAGRAVG